MIDARGAAVAARRAERERRNGGLERANVPGLSVRMSQPPPGGSAIGGGETAQLGLASFNTFCAGGFALGLLLRLDGVVALPWGGVFAPFLLGHATAAGAHALKRRAHVRAGVDVNPSTMLVRVRDSEESRYKLLQSCGVISSCGLLIAAIMMGPRNDGSDGSDTGSAVPVVGLSYSLICLPIWLAWAAETWVWLQYRKYRNRAIRGGLTPNHAAIKIRGHDEIFFYNLMVTLVARMLDGAYSCTWMTLFTVVWVQLLLIAVLYAICFMICLVGLGLSHTHRFQPALAAYRKVFLKSLLLVTFGSITVVLYYMFWHSLARRMDGESSVTHAQILLPLIIKVGPELLSSFILYSTGGHTTIHDSIRSTTDEGERVQWEREKEEYAAIAPKCLMQQSATFFKAVDPGMGPGTEGKTSGLRLRAAGGSNINSKGDQQATRAEAESDTARVILHAAAPPGGVWEKCYDDAAESSQAGARERRGEGVKVHLSATEAAPSKVPHDNDNSYHSTAGRARANDGTSTVAGGDTALTSPPAVSEGWGQKRDATGKDFGSEEGGRECDICLSAPCEVALLPCGHGGMCAACAHASVELPGHCCPICRQKVLMVAELQLVSPSSRGEGGERAMVEIDSNAGASDVESGTGCGPIFLVVPKERATTPTGDGLDAVQRSARTELP